VPGNGQAVTGFVFSVIAVSLLVLSFHRGLAQAGFIIGWVGIGLSILAIVAWILVVALWDPDNGSPFDPDTTTALARVLWG